MNRKRIYFGRPGVVPVCLLAFALGVLTGVLLALERLGFT